MKNLLIAFAILISSITFSQTLDTKLDDWHKAASDANFDAYFGFMDSDFVFLGTAPGERWKKDAFEKFSEPYFDKGQAWDFKASNRIWQFNSDSTVAWFDEDLDTWMKDCRGSGVLIKSNNEWKIAYYNLTVLIENEKIKAFIELREKE
ncbi:nuclear transport factor 2 family protein [Crocinitomicaceae bacterium]|nr:nuclear transport factor 2 family protein [Crocinitomicaceae bacterium]